MLKKSILANGALARSKRIAKAYAGIAIKASRHRKARVECHVAGGDLD